MRILAIMKRIVQQFMHDKRSLALLIIAPLFALTLLWIVLDIKHYEPSIALTDVPDMFKKALEDEDIYLSIMNNEQAQKALEKNEIDAHIHFSDQTLNIDMEGSDPTAAKMVQQAVSKASQNVSQQKIDTNITFLHGSEDLKTFDNSGPALIGLFVFFFVFLLSGVTFLRERTQGTLERLLATPLKRWEIVAGYLGGFGIFIVIQSIVIVLYTIYVLNMYMEGSIFSVLVVTCLLALMAQSLGTFLSAFAKNEFQMIQFVPLVIVPQVFFSGIFPTQQVEWINIISKIMPLTYGSNALKQMMLRGESLSAVYIDMIIMFGFFILFLLLNVLALKKHRKI